MTRFLALALATVAAAPLSAHALAPGKPLASYDVRSWAEEAGLPQPTVRAIAQTPDGYLWVGTDHGLARFDGVAFATFDAEPALAGAEVRALLTDRTGALWIGIRDGHGLVRHAGGRFETMLRPARLKGGPTVVSLLEDGRGRLWTGGWRSLAWQGGGAYDAFTAAEGLPTGDVWALARATDGALWIGAGATLARLRERSFEIVPLPAPQTTVRALVADGAEGLWIATDAGLLRRQGQRTRVFGTADGLPHPAAQALLRDRAGSLWVGTRGGLARWDGERFEAIGRAQGLPDDAVHALFEDREGNLWLGTRNAGLVRLADTAFTRVGAAEGLSSERTLTVRGTRDGSLWVGTMGDGLMRLQGGKVETFRAADGLCTDWITTLAEDADGGLWIGGTGSGHSNLCRLHAGRFRSFTSADGLAEGLVVRGLHVDRRGTLWIGSAGLLRLDGERLVAEGGGPKEHANVYGAHEDRRGRLWVSSGPLLHRREGNVWTRVPGNQRLGTVYTFLEEGDGTIWMGAARGLGRWRDGVLVAFGPGQGLAEDPVYGLLDDGRGFLWLSTPKGIRRVSRQELETAARGGRPAAAMAFGLGDGLRTSRCEGGYGGPAAWKDTRGRLWFPTSRGLVWVDPAALPAPGPPAPVVIERLTIDGERRPLTGPVQAPPGRGRVQVDFTALALRAPEKVRFRHRLEPFDADWIDGGGHRSASYLNLPPGAYRFRVLASRQDGAFTDPGATLSFALAPHLHQRGWFRGSLVAALALAGLAAYRLRVRQLEARHRALLSERTRIARDIHDTLAQGFTGISLELEAATRRLPSSPADAQQNLDKARVLVRMSLAEARRAVWDLRTQALETGDLPRALASLARQLGGAAIAVEATGTVRKLPEDRERALLRVAQEAMTNALKHASAARTKVTLIYGPETVELQVVDDGVGFDPAANQARAGHFGLLGMQERVRNLDGTLAIHSAPGEGTRVTARLPVDPLTAAAAREKIDR